MHVPQSEYQPDKLLVRLATCTHHLKENVPYAEKLPKTVSKFFTDRLNLSEVSVATRLSLLCTKLNLIPNWTILFQIGQSFCGKSRISVDIWSRALKSEYVGLSYSDKYS